MKKVGQWALLLALPAMVVTSAFAQAPKERVDSLVRQNFFSGFKGDREALKQGMVDCEAVLAKNPKDAEAMVWHGAGSMFQATLFFQSGESQKGVPLWTKGLAEMDAAVKLEPESVGVRIPRASFLLPASRFVPDPAMSKSLLGRAVEDFETVYAKRKDGLEKMSTHRRGELLMGVAEANLRAGNRAKGRVYLEQVVKTCPDSPYATEAKIWLALPEETPNSQYQHACVGCHVEGK